jgi:hypothetical protein
VIATTTIQCETCGEIYFLRAGVGLDAYHLHTFDCPSCSLPIELAVRIDSSNNLRFEGKTNINFIEINSADLLADEKLKIINLHPSFAFDPNEIHERFAFPSTSYARIILPHMRKVPGKYQDVARQFEVPNASSLWGNVKNSLLLESKSGQEKRIAKLIDSYLKERRKYFPETRISSPQEAALNFFDALFYPRFNMICAPAIQLIQKVKIDNPTAFSEFMDFYRANLQTRHLEQYLSIFTDYFKIYHQVSQVLVHSRIGDENVDSKIMSSKSFEDTKLYYGQAYESLTSFFVIFACTNNMLLGRKYDEFQTMNLTKYINDVSKEGKAKPFSMTSEFFIFNDGLDSTLRNGSHHASIWRNGEMVIYRSGGTGAERNIAYSRYLHLCNKLTISLAVLFKIELELRSM